MVMSNFFARLKRFFSQFVPFKKKQPDWLENYEYDARPEKDDLLDLNDTRR
jgi:hypothetical protein